MNGPTTRYDAVIFVKPSAAVPQGTTIKEYRCDGLYNVRFNAVGNPASVTITNPHATDPLLIGIAETYSVLKDDYVQILKVLAGDSQEVLISPGSYFLCWASDVSSADRAIVASTNGAFVDFSTTDTIISEAYNYEFDVPSGQTSNFILTFNSPTTGTVLLQLLDSTNAVIATQTVDVTLGANSITWSNIDDPIAAGNDYTMRITPSGTGLASLSVDLDLTGGANHGPQNIAANGSYTFGPFVVSGGFTFPVNCTCTSDGVGRVYYVASNGVPAEDVTSESIFVAAGPNTIDFATGSGELPPGTWSIVMYAYPGDTANLTDFTIDIPAGVTG